MKRLSPQCNDKARNGRFVTMRCLPLIGIAVCAIWSAPVEAQTITISLSSPQNGGTVAAGANISWSIDFAVSAGDNVGLALLSVDLTQAAANPARFDIPPATSVPTTMGNFSRP